MIATTEYKTTPLFVKEFQGTEVPALGFGTYELEGSECSKAVTTALETGYRHVDTARMYENEQEVGWGIRRSSIDRDEIFLTSKIWRDDLEPDKLSSELEKSLSDLQVEYLDLALVHWPNPSIPLEGTLFTLQKFKEEGKIRNYGVSNFPPSLLKDAIKSGEVFCNQVEFHPLLGQDALLDLARENNLALTAYSPLGQGEAIHRAEIKEMAEKHDRQPSQIILRWLVEQDNVLAIPRSSKPEHIESNFEIFDFELDAEDYEQFAKLPKDKRMIDPEFAPNWES